MTLRLYGREFSRSGDSHTLLLIFQEAGTQQDLDDLTKEETTLLADTLEGLLVDGSHVKGGRLPKLVEQITTHQKNGRACFVRWFA